MNAGMADPLAAELVLRTGGTERLGRKPRVSARCIDYGRGEKGQHMSEDSTEASGSGSTVPVGTRVISRRTGPRKRKPAEKVDLSGAAAERGARQAEVRHDAVMVPVDGDLNDELRLANQHPDFEYAWLNDFAMQTFGLRRGYVQEKWGPDSARPEFYFGTQNDGETIRMRELILCKIPKLRAKAIQENSPKRRRHDAIMDVLQGRAPADPGVTVMHKSRLV